MHSWVVFLLTVGSGKYLTLVQYLSIVHDQQCNDRFHYILGNIKLSKVSGTKLTIFTSKDGKSSSQRVELLIELFGRCERTNIWQE